MKNARKALKVLKETFGEDRVNTISKVKFGDIQLITFDSTPADHVVVHYPEQYDDNGRTFRGLYSDAEAVTQALVDAGFVVSSSVVIGMYKGELHVTQMASQICVRNA